MFTLLYWLQIFDYELARRLNNRKMTLRDEWKDFAPPQDVTSLISENMFSLLIEIVID